MQKDITDGARFGCIERHCPANPRGDHGCDGKRQKCTANSGPKPVTRIRSAETPVQAHSQHTIYKELREQYRGRVDNLKRRQKEASKHGEAPDLAVLIRLTGIP